MSIRGRSLRGLRSWQHRDPGRGPRADQSRRLAPDRRAGVLRTGRTDVRAGRATSYTFRVTASNAIGTGPASAAFERGHAGHVPAPPTGVSVTAGNGQATVGWTAPASSGGSAIAGSSDRLALGPAQGARDEGSDRPCRDLGGDRPGLRGAAGRVGGRGRRSLAPRHRLGSGATSWAAAPVRR